MEQVGAGGAAQIDDRVACAEKAVEETGASLDDLLVKGNGAVKHVIKDLGDLFGEDKVFLYLVDGEKGVFVSGQHGGKNDENEQRRK